MRNGLPLVALLLCACAQEDTSNITFLHHDEPTPGAAYDTDWQPANSPVQLRFLITAKMLIDAQLSGTAALSHDKQPTLSFTGTSGRGSFEMDLGFEISAKLRINQPPLSWEGSIPYVPQSDLRFADKTTFTPFLLEGTGEQPHLADEAAKRTFFQVPIPGLAIPMLAGGFVSMSASGKLSADLRGEKITTKPSAGGELVHVREGENVAWPGGTRGESSYVAQAKFAGEIVLYPAVEISVQPISFSYTLAEFPIPVDLRSLLKTEQTWSFDAQPLELAPAP